MTTANTNTNNQLSLFQFGTPAGNLGRFLAQKDSEKDGKKVGISLSLASRKAIAKELNLSPKKDGAVLDREMLKLSDELKTTIGREVTGIIGSANFTGGRLSVRVNKQGLKRVTCSFVEVKRHDEQPSDALLAKIADGLGVSVSDVKDALEEANKKEAAMKQPVDVTVELDEKAPEVTEPVLDEQTAELATATE